jgi:hypothetical protein
VTSPPRLARRDVAAQVEKLYGMEREHFLLAFHGTGEEDTFDVAGARVWVRPVGSELELRKQLLKLGPDDRVAFLVPWTVEMPIDLQGRFAKSGRVFRIDRDERVKALFGVADSDDGLRGHPLVEYLLTHHLDGEFTVAGGRLTVDAMWSAWLEKIWGLDAAGELALDVLLGFGAVDPRGAQFVKTMEQRGELGGRVRAELLVYLDKRLGPAGSLLWKAWESGRGAAAIELAIVAAALGDSDAEAVRLWMRLTAQQLFGEEVPQEALTRLGEVADTALRYVERRRDKGAVRALVLAADARAQDPALRPYLIASPRLPSAWRGRLDRLGDALSEVAKAPDAARGAARDSVEQFRELARHELFSDEEQTTTVHRAEMAVRLATWLAARTDREIAAGVTPYADVEALAGWYVREGGYIDWARRSARGIGDGVFARGVAAVLAVVDMVREELDRRFARALPAWHEAGRPATQVVPIDQAIHRIASDFLAEEEDRRLLVVLMDGMSWAVAAEMLESMGGRPAAWGPLAWHGMGKNRVGDASYPPVLTNFPTLTEVSRSAFFAGKPMPAGPSPNTNDDPKRWQANRDVIKYCDATAVPRLLLRGEGHTRDGSASDEALSLVADRTRRLVGVVINTVDMSLKSDAAHRHRWTVETVKSLRDLLDKAAEVGRAVLLCSDHGHVPADRLASSGAAMKEGARWRVWQESGDPIADYEIGLKAGNGVWAPRGAHGVVLIADDAHRYGGGAGAGEHGGASLAEVVAPCVLIGNTDSVAATEDNALVVRPVRAPTWWHFDVQVEPPADVDGAVEPRPNRKRRPANENQMTLPTIPAPPEPAQQPATVKGRATVDSPLSRSEVLAARVPKAADRERVIGAVEFLRQRNGVAAAAAFAQEMNEFVGRIAGLVSKLQEVLNVDGYQVLRFDRQNQQVHLDLQKLAQQFEVRF